MIWEVVVVAVECDSEMKQ
uniref:Uncharacterized protein n=1 Tax=Arundo donax TaxID=35708 RepID=A0A0A8YT83_ARUDO